MPRIRSIKPEFWVDAKLARATSRDARMLYMGLWNLADEHARLQGDPLYLKGQLFPYEPDLDADAVERLLEELLRFGVARRYVVGDEAYLYLPKLGAHQRLEPSKAKSKHPEPPPEVLSGAQIFSDETETTAATQQPDCVFPQVNGLRGSAQIFSDQSEPNHDESAPSYGTGDREHVGREPGVPTTSGTTSVPTDEINAGTIVAAWVDGARETTGELPAQRLRAQIGRQAAELLRERKDPARLLAAAREAGRKGFADLPRELLKSAVVPPQRDTGPVPPYYDRPVVEQVDIAPPEVAAQHTAQMRELLRARPRQVT